MQDCAKESGNTGKAADQQCRSLKADDAKISGSSSGGQILCRGIFY
jgi:hypothetical protein